MNIKELWSSILKELARNISRANFVTWFQNTAVLSFENGVLRVGTPNAMACNWVSSHYMTKILDSAHVVNADVMKVEIVVDGALANSDDGRSSDVATIAKQEPPKMRKMPNKNEVKVGENGIRSRMLNPRYTLESFIVGKDNQLAHAACQAVGHRPGHAYNPLFVYGGVGLGKTHLLQATGNAILKSGHQSVVYLTAERFMNEVVEAIRKYNAQDFRKQYRSIDCLIIDDIQFFANKERTQEEFFHTFNELYDANKQIIISSDRPPKELSGIEDRLKSRFESGMVVEVYFPDYETRLAILQRKCQEVGAILPPEVLEFIASNVHSSIRELEGVLTQAIAQAKLEQSTPTIRSIGRVLKRLDNGKEDLVGITKEEIERKVAVRTAEDVMSIVADYYRIQSVELTGSCRKKEIMVPRQVAMYLIYEILRYSYDAIGDLFGGRNHTTVLHACNQVKNRLQEDQKLVRDMHSLKREMGM
ncbi:MAG: chromosomal replication initiator protein DnaA [Patescibacteria group bacterium]